ncbi:Disks large-associated protein 1 [Zootermopsis nevadensis]|uniref:Disks large-associated protein 1 n=2 Tax=Zootermopsis nevadensis TaxID=136037 RepID=A0A067QRP0_ZOONE|nr:Disks large-associated protein 1 [Zootermopsis nevadensis]
MGDDANFVTTGHHTVNGVSGKVDTTETECNRRPLDSSQCVDSYSSSTKEEFFSGFTSNIQKSAQNLMSSMLTTDSSFSSTHYESSVIQSTKSRDATDFSSPLKNSSVTSVPRDGFGAFSPIRCSPESPKIVSGSCVTSSPRDSSSLSSPLKHSPDSPKTSSKDSLSTPATTSPQKRSPGTVRVVEFTSQTKSYVRTAFVSGSSVESASTYTAQGYSDSPQLKELVDGSKRTSYVRNIHSELAACDSSDNEGSSVTFAAKTNASNSETTVWASKSFIQQRVERLYGPGALAQGFFRRTRHKPSDEVQGPCESHTPHNGYCHNSSPTLPVLRHLRPEFRAQLSLGPATKKLNEHDGGTPAIEETRADVSKRSSARIIPIQQQVSVESLTESLTDLQPAAPDVVLPIEQTQSVSNQPSERSEDGGDTVSQIQKDGHYFLKLLKQEIDRLNGLVETTEADLTSGGSLPEEALGKLRAASGQAKLLIRQKLQQFEGLCHKNIAQSSEEPFPTTSEDLAGFWDMVMLQVEHVNKLFEEITALRAADWVEAKVRVKDVVDGIPKRRVAGGTKRSSAAPTKSSTSSEAARKAREEGRRKMMEERRRAMREKRDAGATSDQVEIFVPQENGK